MHKFISISVALLIAASNAFAEDALIQRAKNTIFPDISTKYTIEQFLWKPPENRSAKWWKPETYVIGNEEGNCTRQVWTRTGNDIRVSCMLLDSIFPIKFFAPFNVPFFGVNERYATQQAEDQARNEATSRERRFNMDWSHIKRFNAIQNSKNLKNFYYHTNKKRRVIYVNMPKIITSAHPDITLISAQSSDQERPYAITVKTNEFISNKIDLSGTFDDGKDSAFDNGFFYGSEFQTLYKDFLSSFINCFNKKDETSKSRLLKSYQNLISYKFSLWNTIAKQFNVQYFMRDSMTLNIKIRHLPTGQFKIIDAYTTARWTDGTQKKFRIENTPEKTILTAKKTYNIRGSEDDIKERNNPAYEKLLRTFIGSDVNPSPSGDMYAKNIWNLYHQPSMTLEIQ